MKNASQAPGLLRSRSLSFLFMLVTYCSLLLMPGWARGQTKQYATVKPSSGSITTGLFGSGISGVNNPENAAIPNESNHAEIVSNRIVVGLLGSGDGWLQVKFSDAVSAGATTVFRISAPVESGLGVNLGSLLGLVNNMLPAQLYSGSTSASDGNQINGIAVNSTMVVDGDGNYYLLVNSPNNTTAYNSVRIKLTYPSALNITVASSLRMNVYNAFVYEGVTCGKALLASTGRVTGVNISLGDVVQNPQQAIDGKDNTHSSISFGGLAISVASSVFQDFYFSGLSSPRDYFKVKLSLGGSALNLNVLGNYEVRAYNGNDLVYTKKLQGALVNGLDLLGLLQSGNPVEIPFGPGVAFDRVAVGINATVGATLASSPLQVYSVERYGLGNSTLCKEANPPLEDEGGIHMLADNKKCATELVGHNYANFPYNATDGNNGTFAVLEATSGVLLGAGAYSGNIHLGYSDTNKPGAGKTSYVRIDMGDDGLLSSLLNGSLGGLLGTTINNVLFGNHYFTVDVYDDPNASPILSGSSANSFNGKPIRVVQDKFGKYYVAITPTVGYKSVKITEHFPSLVGAEASRTMKVYGMCYSTGAELCEQGFATFSESSGITLDLLGLGAAGVTDAQNAIDLGSDGKTNLNTASKISVGAVGVAGTMMQHVQFHGLSTDRDHFRVKMKMQSNGVVSADVIGSIIVKAYNGDQEVYSQRLNERLIPGLDLLNLLSTGQMINLPFAPGKAFDRVAVGIASLVSANVLANPLEIYSIERFSQACPDPELKWDPKTKSPFKTPACVDEVTSFENVNFPYEAITDNPNADTYATLTAGAGVAAGLGSYSSHIELKYSGVGAAAHEVSYIRVDTEGNLFNALLGGSLGNALGNVLGSVALGNQYIVVQAKDAAGNPVGTAHSSVTGFNNEFVKLVKDKDGKFYLAVTAPGAYQSVRIEYHHTALVGGMGSSSMKLYSMCRETEFDVCEQATFTSWDGNGIALDILDLTKGGVANPEFAIDADNSNYSTLNLGVVGVAASVSQKVYFKTKSDISDELRVRLQLANPGILNLDLFGNTKLIFYNGEQNVKEMTLASGLINNIDLLGLFNSGGVQSFTFAPGVEYDRVELKIASLVGVNTSAPILLYGMSRITAGCPDPDFLSPSEVFKSPVCADGVELGNVRAVDDITNAVDGDYNTYANMRSDAGAIFGIGNKESIIELKYGAAVGANTTSYLRIGDDAGILESLLSGSIGEAVYGLLNNVALGDNYFVVRAKNGANTVLEGSSRNGFAGANGKMKIVQDKAGRYYVAISPSADYTSVEIKAFSESLVGLLAKGYNLHVYGMCHETDFSGCQEGFSTSWDGSGLSVGVTGVGGYGVKDAFKALNNNNNGDFSTLSLGTLNVAGHIQQNIQYTNTVAANTPFRLKMAVGTGTVNVSVFDDIRIIGYKDGSIVYNQNLQTAVLGGVSLGTLFNNGGAHDVDFAMDQEVDEIALRLNSLVNATVGVPDVRLYYIVQDCKAPMFTSWKSFKVDNDENIKTVKGGEKVEYTIHVRNTGSVALNDYIVTDAIPANTTYVAGSGGTFANGAVTFTGIDVAAGATATVSFKVTVNPDLTGVTKISNVALVKKDATDPGTETFPPSPTNPNEPKTGEDKGTDIPVEQISSISTWKAALAKSAGATVTSVSGGETIDYTIYIKNTGNQALTGVQVTEAVPAGTTLATGSSVNFPALDIAVGDTKSVTFQVTVKSDLTGITSISNVATVTTTGGTPIETTPADPTNPTVGPDPTKDPGDPTQVGVEQLKSVVAWKAYTIGTDDKTSTSVSAGNEVTYHIYVRNSGNQALTNVQITDVLPTGVTWKSGGSHTGGTVTFTIPTLAVGATSAAQNFVVTVNNNLTGISEIKNIAVVKADPASSDEFESFPPLDNTSSPTVPDVTATPGTVLTVNPVTSLQIGIVGVSNNPTNPGQAVEGNTVNYTISITNNGNLDLTSVTITNPLANNTIYMLGSASNGGTEVAGVITFGNIDIGIGETKTFTYSVTVDAIPQSVTAISTIATASYGHEEVGQPNKTVDATSVLQTNCNPIGATDIVVSGDLEICSGESTEITLSASITNPVFLWYENAQLIGTPLVGAIQNIAKTYYVVVNGDGACYTGQPLEVAITVNPEPATPTITPSSAIVCEGEGLVLTATPGSRSYQWYRGTTLLSEPSNVLTISKADLSDAGEYKVMAVNGTGCTSDASASVEVAVIAKPIASITPSSSSICAGENIILTSNSATNNKWYRDGVLLLDEAGNTLTAETITVNKSGSYTLVIVDAVTGCKSLPSVPTVITVNPLPVITLIGETQMTVALGSSVALPTISNPDANVTYTWYDEKGKVIDPLLPVTLNSAGVYTYTIVANNNVSGCMASTTVIITVFDSNGCPPIYKRHYASSQKWVSTLPLLNGVNDAGNAVDGNPRTHSKLYVTAVVLGLGTTYQDLKFDAKIDKGIPVTIKIGPGGGLLGLGDGLSIVGRRNGSDIGVIQPVGGKLLSLIDGESSYEYTFVPSDASGPQDYDEVRIIYGSLASVAKTFNIYGAYINEPVSQLDCNQPEIIDVLSGTHDLGLAALTATVGVRDAWNVVDSDPTNYAQLYSGVGVLAEAQLTATFRSVSLPGDKLEIRVSNPNQILQLSLLNAMTVQRYHGTTPVGSALSSNGNLLKLVLLSGNNDGRIIVDPQDDLPYDRVKISLGGAVNVLDFLNVHYIKRTPKIEITNPVVDGKIELCPSESLNLTIPQSCVTYEVTYNGTPLDPIQGALGGFKLPSGLTAGEYTLLVQQKRYGCNFGEPQEVLLTLLPSPVSTVKLNDVEQTTITLAPYDKLNVEVTTDATIAKWEINESGTWNDYTVASTAKAFTYDVPLKPAGSQVKFRALLTSDKGCDAYTGEIVLNIKAQEVDYDKSKLVIVKGTATADGVDLNTVEAQIRDKFDKAIAGVTVDFVYNDLATGTDKTAAVTTGAVGNAVLNITSTKIGQVTVNATVATKAISNSPALVTFVAGAIDFNKSNIEVVRTGAIADGVDKNRVLVNLFDKFDNPVADSTVVYTVTGLAGVQTTSLTGTSDASGQFALDLMSEKIGTASITATANGTAIKLGSPALVTFVAGAIDFNKSNIEVVRTGAIADGVDKNRVLVNLFDKFDNPVADSTVVYTVTGLAGVQTTSLTGTSDASGQFALDLMSEKIGTASITATANGTAIKLGSPATVTFVAGAIDFNKSNIEVVRTGAIADGVDKNRVLVNLFDKFDNPVADSTVVYTVTGLAGVQTTSLTGTSDASGQFALDLMSEKIGTASITATANGTAIKLGSPALVTFVAGAIDFNKSNIEVVRTGAIADGVDKNRVRVNLFDKFDNPVADSTVVYTVTGLAGVQTTSLTGTSDASGQFALDLMSEKIGTASITATANGTAIKLGSPATVTFVAGAIDFNKSNIEVVRTDAIADGVDKNRVLVNLFDKFDNPVADSTVVYTVTGLAGVQTTSLTGTSDASGQFALDLMSEKIGTASITATANGTAIKLGSPALVTFVAGAVDYDKSNLKVTKDNAVADGVDYNEFTATIMDAFENPIANKDVVFSITNPDGTTEQRTITTDVAGQAVIKTTSTKPGTVTVDAQVDATSINGSPAIAKFVIANNLLIAKVADQARVKAGTNTSFTVTITNNGPAKIEAGKVITLGEIPSTGLTITGYAITSGNAIAAGTGNTATVTTNSEITVGGTIIVKVTAAVGADAPSTITNGIKVWGPDKDPGTDPEDDKDDTPEVPVDRESNLRIVKKADQTRVKAGENTTFTLTITNDGPSTIDVGKKIQLTERPGAGVSIDKYEIVGTNATISGTANNAVVTTTAKIAKGQTIVVKVTAKVDADAPSTITNGITVWGPDKDPGTDPEDDTDDTPPVPVDRDYKLTIEKVADESKVKAGESTTFTVTITNNGPSVMEIGKDIKLVERPGAGVSIEKYEIVGSNATISNTANDATVKTTAKLTVGGTIIVKITAKVDDEAPEKITNGISVWGPGKEPGTDPEDDKDDTPEVPVVYPLIQAVDDVAETKTAVAVEIDVLANDIVTKWDINPTSLEVVSSSVGATTTVGIDGKVTYISSRDKIGEDTFTYRVKDIKGRWSNTATVRVAVMNNDLDIPNIITPNGDGKNDEFRINGLELYDRVVLTIVNRWGNEVYKSNKYNNDWSGVGLSEGTYFYVLELVKGGKSEVQKGWVTIKSN